MNTIYSIIIVTIVVFVFFWLVKTHKKKEIEYFTSNKIGETIKKFQNMNPTDSERDAFCEVVVAKTQNITKEECMELLEKHGDVKGALAVFAKAGNLDMLSKFI